MKKYVNNKLVDMTQEEIDEYNKNNQEQHPQEPTLEERIASVEEVILNLL
ncbi:MULTISPECIES: hypothetical protein [Clostridia]|nr:hypothetical protein [Peptostreptococcus porci]MDY5098693.1 hypothetical protein [Clostridium sp.]MDY5437468.1 hypothetical protein [Peptostreptococcus porci]